MLDILRLKNQLTFRLLLEMRRTLLGPAELADNALILQRGFRNVLACTHHLMQATIKVKSIDLLLNVQRPIVISVSYKVIMCRCMRVIESEGARLTKIVVALDIGCILLVLDLLICLGIRTSFLQCRQNVLH